MNENLGVYASGILSTLYIRICDINIDVMLIGVASVT